MSCANCEKLYKQNLDHVRILAKLSAKITQTDQVIFRVNGRVPYYEFAPTAWGEIIETVRFDRLTPDIDILSDNEVPGIETLGSGGESERGTSYADLGEGDGGVLSGSEPEAVQGTVKKSRKSRAVKESNHIA